MSPGDLVIISDVGLIYSDAHNSLGSSAEIGMVIEREDMSTARAWRVLVNGEGLTFFEEDLTKMESKDENK